jgi:hypothetical protein
MDNFRLWYNNDFSPDGALRIFWKTKQEAILVLSAYVVDLPPSLTRRSMLEL